jgi:hypothetical protein
MTNAQGDRLFAEGMELAKNFKTSYKYGRQPILLTDEAKAAMELYMQVTTYYLPIYLLNYLPTYLLTYLTTYLTT